MRRSQKHGSFLGTDKGSSWHPILLSLFTCTPSLPGLVFLILCFGYAGFLALLFFLCFIALTMLGKGLDYNLQALSGFVWS